MNGADRQMCWSAPSGTRQDSPRPAVTWEVLAAEESKGWLQTTALVEVPRDYVHRADRRAARRSGGAGRSAEAGFGWALIPSAPMGGLRPWHLFVLLVCLLVVAGIVFGIVALVKRGNRPRPTAAPWPTGGMPTGERMRLVALVDGQPGAELGALVFDGHTIRAEGQAQAHLDSLRRQMWDGLDDARLWASLSVDGWSTGYVALLVPGR
jgi:hypothetical protein